MEGFTHPVSQSVSQCSVVCMHSGRKPHHLASRHSITSMYMQACQRLITVKCRPTGGRRPIFEELSSGHARVNMKQRC